jgi:hypothetical protein
MTPLLLVLNRISGTRYHEPSARGARRRIVAYCRHQTRQASSEPSFNGPSTPETDEFGAVSCHR